MSRVLSQFFFFLLIALAASGCRYGGIRPLTEADWKMIHRSDRLYDDRAEKKNLDRAAGLLSELIRDAGEQYPLLWRLARVRVRQGEAASGAEAEARLDEAAGAANRAIRLERDQVEGLYWLAAARWAEAEASGGHLAMVLRKDTLKNVCSDVIRLDPYYEGAGGHRLLGITFFDNTWLTGGSVRQAQNHLERALEKGPTHPLNLLWLARLYAYLDRWEEARDLLVRLLARPTDPRWIPEARRAKDRAREMLREWRKSERI